MPSCVCSSSPLPPVQQCWDSDWADTPACSRAVRSGTRGGGSTCSPPGWGTCCRSPRSRCSRRGRSGPAGSCSPTAPPPRRTPRPLQRESVCSKHICITNRLTAYPLCPPGQGGVAASVLTLLLAVKPGNQGRHVVIVNCPHSTPVEVPPAPAVLELAAQPGLAVVVPARVPPSK